MLRYLFYALAVIQFIFGLGFMVIPETVGAQYGAVANEAAVAIARYWAATLLPLAYVYWVAATATASPLKLAIVRMGALLHAFGLAATVLAYSTGVTNAGGTALSLLLDGVFLVGFGYYGWVKTIEKFEGAKREEPAR